MSNGRIEGEETPEGRLAAVAVTLSRQFSRNQREPDYADFRESFKPYVQRELLKVRLEEAHLTLSLALMDRVKQLHEEIMSIEFPMRFQAKSAESSTEQ